MAGPDSLLSPEARLLLAAVNATQSSNRVLQCLSDPDLDWNRVVALAEREKATAILWEAVRVHEASMPPLRARQLGMLASVSDFRMGHHERLLGKVVDRLAALDIPVVLLKGAALAATVYRSFARRPMYDLDLLVHREHGQRAWNALRADGWLHEEDECPAAFYTEHYHLPPLDDPSGTGLAVELHTEPWHGGVRLDPGEFWKDSQIIDLDGRSLRVPSISHQVLHLATHFAWGHMLQSAAWRTIRDLGALIASGRVDWADVVAIARRSGGTSCCFWTFDIARSLADLEIPTEVLDELRPPLPTVAIEMLRRHYIGTLFYFSPARCPSLLLERLLWTAGHASGWPELGRLRPWLSNGDQVLRDRMTPSNSLTGRLATHLRGIPGWMLYLRSVMAPPRNA